MLVCKYYVYLLKSEICNRCYIGYTINIKQRLRKHNGEIKGGAKKTSRHRPWKLVMWVSGFTWERTALQYEFMIQHPPKRLRKKGGGIAKYMKIMKELLKGDRICSTAPPNSELHLINFFSEEKYYLQWINL